MIRILRSELGSPSKYRCKLVKDGFLDRLNARIKTKGVDFEIDESDLVLSACRSNDLNVMKSIGNKLFLDENQLSLWVNEKLLPNTIILSIGDEDTIRLLIFCIEITYQMFAGGTRATVTQKGFRERRRTFEDILSDQFAGKLGEVMLKKFLEREFPAKIELDWDISKQIKIYRNDIANSKKIVSIKSSPALAGIWAEADKNYDDYGISVKCSVPQPAILQFFIEVCGFSKLLDFAEGKIPDKDERFTTYLKKMRERIRSYKCGEIQSKLKGYVCGYFETADYEPVKEGIILQYLGKVREERYLVPINALKYTKKDWEIFLKNTELMK